MDEVIGVFEDEVLDVLTSRTRPSIT